MSDSTTALLSLLRSHGPLKRAYAPLRAALRTDGVSRVIGRCHALRALLRPCTFNRAFAAMDASGDGTVNRFEFQRFFDKEALLLETRMGLAVVRSGETLEGARRFAEGAGRHGSFD